ncbi:type II toxin-antitoxin system Phd/YefM family antitoxin [Mesorhizobium australicum]
MRPQGCGLSLWHVPCWQRSLPGKGHLAWSDTHHYCSEYNYYRTLSLEKGVSATDANRRFSLLLRGVREGQSYVVTSHGRPVARIVPADHQEGWLPDRARRCCRGLSASRLWMPGSGRAMSFMRTSIEDRARHEYPCLRGRGKRCGEARHRSRIAARSPAR